jgi:hypothetical protein
MNSLPNVANGRATQDGPQGLAAGPSPGCALKWELEPSASKAKFRRHTFALPAVRYRSRQEHTRKSRSLHLRRPGVPSGGTTACGRLAYRDAAVQTRLADACTRNVCVYVCVCRVCAPCVLECVYVCI